MFFFQTFIVGAVKEGQTAVLVLHFHKIVRIGARSIVYKLPLNQ